MKKIKKEEMELDLNQIILKVSRAKRLTEEERALFNENEDENMAAVKKIKAARLS
jgi:hypothetical protein